MILLYNRLLYKQFLLYTFSKETEWCLAHEPNWINCVMIPHFTGSESGSGIARTLKILLRIRFQGQNHNTSILNVKNIFMIKLNTPSPFHAMWKRTANSRRRHDWNIPRLPDKLIDLSYIFLEVHNALKLVWSWPNRIISRSSVARSSVIVRFVLTKWANGSLWFDQMDQWELLIWSKRNGRWLMNVLRAWLFLEPDTGALSLNPTLVL